MFKFNSDNIFVGYIKQLLKSFNLPQCKVWKPGMYVYADQNYIYNNYLLKAKSNKIANNLTDFKIIKTNYFYGDKILNLTKNLELKSNIYDSYTHKYLGDYLRFYRDYKNIDLMSMYNCFSNEAASNLDLTIDLDDTEAIFNSSDENYIIYSIPIKEDKEYTICIDCPTTVEMCASYYNNKLLNDSILTSINSKSWLKNSYLKITNTRFKKPFIYNKLKTFLTTSNNRPNSAFMQECNLKLFIKLPSTCKSAITVLEGDYRVNFENYFDTDSNAIKKVDGKVTLISDKGIVYGDIVSKLQLAYINSNISYPFSDRLIEILTGNAITSDSSLDTNIFNIQKTLTKKQIKGANSKLTPPTHYGVWNNNLRAYIYEAAKRAGLVDNVFDITGYIDKDIEQHIGG